MMSVLTPAMLSFWLPLSVAFAALAGVVVVIIAQLRNHKEQQNLVALLESIRTQRMSAEQDRLAAVVEEVVALQKHVKALHSKQVELAQRTENAVQERERVAKALLKLTEQHESLASRLAEQQNVIQEVAEQDPASKFYQRAAKLVQQGASLEDIIESCELPRAEAELVYSLYAKPQSRA